ncbi:MAG: hypothetical protein ACOC7U_05040, partial [Spirochaetota bacterium]
ARAYGSQIIDPDEVNDLEALPENAVVYGIKNIEIKKIADNSSPVFIVTYEKLITSAQKIIKKKMQEKLYLKPIDQCWRIVDVERKLLK